MRARTYAHVFRTVYYVTWRVDSLTHCCQKDLVNNYHVFHRKLKKFMEEQEIFEVVEQMPEFPNGGLQGLMQFLSKNIKYPTIAQENGTQGRVTVQFVVNKDGSIVDAKVIRGVDPYLDKEALRVIGAMPKWKPGMQRGKPVRVKYTVPVMFRLQ